MEAIVCRLPRSPDTTASGDAALPSDPGFGGRGVPFKVECGAKEGSESPTCRTAWP
jgi:hypothetical protein